MQSYASLTAQAKEMNIAAKAKKLNSTAKAKAATRGDEWDDEDWDDDDFYMAPNMANPAWNSLFGMMMVGVVGSAQYYGVGAYANTYGITSDRMYYTLAELFIRTGRIADGMALVNKVRRHRIHPDQYVDLTADNEADAMTLLQNAKWIECISTYENFFDCKRWNTEAAYQRTITRTIMDLEGNMEMYSIAPDSKLWVLPLPAECDTQESNAHPKLLI